MMSWTACIASFFIRLSMSVRIEKRRSAMPEWMSVSVASEVKCNPTISGSQTSKSITAAICFVFSISGFSLTLALKNSLISSMSSSTPSPNVSCALCFSPTRWWMYDSCNLSKQSVCSLRLSGGCSHVAVSSKKSPSVANTTPVTLSRRQFSANRPPRTPSRSRQITWGIKPTMALADRLNATSMASKGRASSSSSEIIPRRLSPISDVWLRHWEQLFASATTTSSSSVATLCWTPTTRASENAPRERRHVLATRATRSLSRVGFTSDSCVSKMEKASNGAVVYNCPSPEGWICGSPSSEVTRLEKRSPIDVVTSIA
mmetsp:Transcript_29897/g.70311  ORF Transcript_29897/g.70311 Transcript_29897/m.70311 type:complete len:317 (-) Transcript_29897:845-1795(-)